MIEAVTNEAVYFWNVRERAEKPIIGRIYITYHPSIPYEAFNIKQKQSKRVYSLEEGQEFLLKNRVMLSNITEV